MIKFISPFFPGLYTYNRLIFVHLLGIINCISATTVNLNVHSYIQSEVLSSASVSRSGSSPVCQSQGEKNRINPTIPLCCLFEPHTVAMTTGVGAVGRQWFR